MTLKASARAPIPSAAKKELAARTAALDPLNTRAAAAVKRSIATPSVKKSIGKRGTKKSVSRGR